VTTAATPVTATAARRATRRHPFYGDEPVETPLLDAVEREREALATAEALEAERIAADAGKQAAAEAVLASGKVDELAQAQAKIGSLMDEYLQTYQSAWKLRQEVEAARSTLSSFGVDPSAPIPLTIALRASVGGEHELRAVLDAFRVLALSGGEV
jgi:hypothetical protein